MLGNKSVFLSLPHHKNERHTHNPLVSGPIKVHLPKELSNLFISHIEARHILWSNGAGAHEYVFCSAGGKGQSFNPQHLDTDGAGSTAFSTLFNGILSKAPPIIKGFIPKLTPTLLRTCFIEAATERVDEGDWESLALAMGNSVGTWIRHYAVTLKSRKIQLGVDRFQHLMQLAGKSPFGSSSSSSVGASTSNGALVPYQHPMMNRPYIPSTLLTVPDDNPLTADEAAEAASLHPGVFDPSGCWRGWESLGADF